LFQKLILGRSSWWCCDTKQLISCFQLYALTFSLMQNFIYWCEIHSLSNSPFSKPKLPNWVWGCQKDLLVPYLISWTMKLWAVVEILRFYFYFLFWWWSLGKIFTNLLYMQEKRPNSGPFSVILSTNSLHQWKIKCFHWR